ncbi:hypothetical protein OH773_06765 [Buttiauxella sp. WJP83]|uniref:hypothetical protein n=1 Tax=Buttiauxella sp. WJP83 TaxID=2986951 RepID=UPI0022DDBA63|nr:hypothetical protein [Buttiauxella sp. WJP83]WBM71937.1 hypothetical protein OH773_06765 [Buttiauxella sp. WJP83]
MNKPDEGLKELLTIGEDGYFYWKSIPENKKRIAKLGCSKVGANRTTGFTDITYKAKAYKAHHVMYWFVTGEWCENVFIDSEDKTDYRFKNLKDIDKSSVQTITHPKRFNKIKVTTIYNKTRKCNRYKAQVSLGGKTRYIGLFDTEDEAIFATWKVKDLLYPNTFIFPPSLSKFIESSI